MADQPALELARVQFGMALQGECMVADGEGLVATGGRTGEAACALRQFEGFTMPVQHRDALQCLQR
ncbi:hypothetical protein D3C71_1676980 [compost metagenome]